MMFAYGETVIRRRGTSSTDRYGNATTDWTSPSEVTIPGCGIAPRESTESTDAGRQGVIVGLTIYAPPGTDLEPTDRLLVRGEEHEVEGEVGDWRSPFSGWEPGIVVNLRRVTG